MSPQFCKDEKHYFNTELSANMEDYIETISILAQKNKIVRVKDIAGKLKIKMPSVTAALNKLKEQKLIHYEKYGYIELTDQGKKIADRIYDKHNIINDFLTKFLHLDARKSQDEACTLEHYLSPETCTQISKLMQYYTLEKEEKKAWVNDFDSIMERRSLLNFPAGSRLRIIENSSKEYKKVLPKGTLVEIISIDNINNQVELKTEKDDYILHFDLAGDVYASIV